ncbi:hypothetical protein D5086_015094 [Populus alba]|uniref:Uncharacterized protein n=1 Tax=Populus alba TaxID=43335 RepID=A0ACC4BZD0_POPAL
MQRGLLDPEKVDPFSLFLETWRFDHTCLYKDTERILGNTFGMCILQDFEALTPNLLARTIETVEGGGLIVLLLRSLSSLTSLYTMVMWKGIGNGIGFRTESHSEATGRFNERFLLSLASCKACVVMDDELNILPISSHIRSITPNPVKESLGAIAAGYSNIFVTAPSPENLKTLFEFICKGFDALEYKYLQPHEHEKLSQVELLVIDEAAAIPLPVVRSLLGPYLVFLSSTVNGYEGTGRSLSLKLLQQLEEQSQISSKNVEGSLSGRLFRKIELSESIRYASRDPIESWLNALLVSRCWRSIQYLVSSRLPLPSECDLYYVNRDTLFSYHKDSELFLQVCLEGQISRKSAIQSLSEGHQPSGDQIPWKFCEQFRDTVFPSFSGARIVRIATHPSAMRVCLSLASDIIIELDIDIALDHAHNWYFEGKITPISEGDDENDVEIPRVRVTEAAEKVSLLEENIKPRTDLPHLLVHLHERKPEKLHYLGVSFGLTLDLLRFWKRRKFAPFYIGQIPNTVTGEHSCMVLKPLNSDDTEVSGSDEWGFFGPFYQDFKRRFARLLEGDGFRSMEYKLAMSVLDPKINYADMEQEPTPSAPDGFWRSLTDDLSLYDLERLKVYTENLADFHLILDIVPILARLYFRGKLPISLSYVQASVLLCVGLQQRNITFIEEQMKLERIQILSLFMKVMKKFYKYLHGIASKDAESTLPRLKERELRPHSISVDDDLKEAAKQVEDGMKSKMEGLLNPEFLQQYAIVGEKEEFDALQKHGGKINPGSVISVKSNRVKPEKHGKEESSRSGKKRAAILIEKPHALDFKGSFGFIFIYVNVGHIRFLKLTTPPVLKKDSKSGIVSGHKKLLRIDRYKMELSDSSSSK